MALWAKWQFMDQSITHKIVYGPQLRFGPYNILWVTSQSINCHMALSAMNYFINIYFLFIIWTFFFDTLRQKALLYKSIQFVCAGNSRITANQLNFEIDLFLQLLHVEK